MTDSIPALVERLRAVNAHEAPYANPLVLALCHEAADALASLMPGSEPSKPTGSKMEVVQPAPAGMPGVEEALSAYNAVWDAAPGITAENVAIVRHEAMTAALAPLAQENEKLKGHIDGLAGLLVETQIKALDAEARATSAEARVAQAVEEEREGNKTIGREAMLMFVGELVKLGVNEDLICEAMESAADRSDALVAVARRHRARTAAAAIRGGEK